jgi:hypothetical protein
MERLKNLSFWLLAAGALILVTSLLLEWGVLGIFGGLMLCGLGIIVRAIESGVRR